MDPWWLPAATTEAFDFGAHQETCERSCGDIEAISASFISHPTARASPRRVETPRFESGPSEQPTSFRCSPQSLPLGFTVNRASPLASRRIDETEQTTPSSETNVATLA